MTPIERETEQMKGKMRGLAKMVDKEIPFGWGFVVMAFATGADARMLYASNCKREDVVRALYEFIERTKERWAEEEPDFSAAAEDEQLARAQQRIAELEGELRKHQKEDG
jgi:rubrerythrin